MNIRSATEPPAGKDHRPLPSYVVDAPRRAASVMLLREGAAGLEVLLLKRHQRSDVHGGVHVFPGGKVDESDAIASRARFRDGHGLQSRFGDSGVDAGQAAILYAAALRELAEECGVNIADTASMHPHSRWITPQPSTSPKRFDTWFFVAPLPAGEVARHDQHEVVESLWLRPRDALQAFWLGTIQLAVPQLMSLAALARHPGVQSALDAAHDGRPPLIQPEHVAQGADRVLAFPGDPLHSVGQVATPGPTRLVWHAGRYEPVAGFEAFFQ